MANVRLFTVVPLPLCWGFLERNFERGFLTTLGLRLPSRGGITGSVISWMSQLKKGGGLERVQIERWEWLWAAL